MQSLNGDGNGHKNGTDQPARRGHPRLTELRSFRSLIASAAERNGLQTARTLILRKASGPRFRGTRLFCFAASEARAHNHGRSDDLAERWQMSDGRWQVADGKWQMTCGDGSRNDLGVRRRVRKAKGPRGLGPEHRFRQGEGRELHPRHAQGCRKSIHHEKAMIVATTARKIKTS